jgi:hypothetical protein
MRYRTVSSIQHLLANTLVTLKMSSFAMCEQRLKHSCNCAAKLLCCSCSVLAVCQTHQTLGLNALCCMRTTCRLTPLQALQYHHLCKVKFLTQASSLRGTVQAWHEHASVVR